MIPEHIQQGELLFAGRRYEVRGVDVAGSDGRLHRREIVTHPGAVVVLPVLDEQSIVMIRNHRPAAGGALWELPAGTLDVPGEPPVACAKRELVEEAGYAAGRIEPLTTFYTSPGICTEQMHAFAAYDLERVGQQLEGGERIVAEVVSWDRTMQMVRDGAITDGKTLATLLYYRTVTMSG